MSDSVMKLESSDTLYIRISQLEFIFARYDHLRPQTLNYSNYMVKPDISLNANMHEALQKMSLTHGDFSFVRVLVEGPVTLVPLSDFDEEMAEEIYFFNLPEQRKRRRVFYDTLSHQESVLLFSVDKDVCHTIEETFPNLLFQSSETPQLLHFASCSPISSSEGRLFVSIMERRMSVCLLRNGKIKQYNSFRLHHTQDAAYYTLRMAQLCGFLPEKDCLYICGRSPLAEQLHGELSPYLPNVELLKAEEEFNANVAALQKDLPYDMITLLLRAY